MAGDHAVQVDTALDEIALSLSQCLDIEAIAASENGSAMGILRLRSKSDMGGYAA